MSKAGGTICKNSVHQTMCLYPKIKDKIARFRKWMQTKPRVMNRDWAARLIFAISIILVVGPYAIAWMSGDILDQKEFETYVGAVIAVAAALYMGQGAFPKAVPDSEAARQDFADQQGIFWGGTALLFVSGFCLVTTLMSTKAVTAACLSGLVVGTSVWLGLAMLFGWHGDHQQRFPRWLLMIVVSVACAWTLGKIMTDYLPSPRQMRHLCQRV